MVRWTGTLNLTVSDLLQFFFFFPLTQIQEQSLRLSTCQKRSVADVSAAIWWFQDRKYSAPQKKVKIKKSPYHLEFAEFTGKNIITYLDSQLCLEVKAPSLRIDFIYKFRLSHHICNKQNQHFLASVGSHLRHFCTDGTVARDTRRPAGPSQRAEHTSLEFLPDVQYFFWHFFHALL